MRVDYTNLLIQGLPLRVLRYLESEFDNIILSYSGGSDSTILLLLALKNEVRLDHVVFTNTKLEAPETMRYVRLIKERIYPELIQVRPKESRKDLVELIDEDWAKVRACDNPHDKRIFRCCNVAKKKPFDDWLKQNNLDNSKSVVLLGLRGVEGFQRTMTVLRLVQRNKLFVQHPTKRRKWNVSWPLALLLEEQKQKMLYQLIDKYHLPLPEKSGCQLCPIYFKFVKEDSDRWRENAAHFSNQKQLIPYLNGETA